jgi:hypothetical protein
LSSQRTRLHNQMPFGAAENALKLGPRKTDTRVGICRPITWQPPAQVNRDYKAKNCISVWDSEGNDEDAVAPRIDAKFELMT